MATLDLLRVAIRNSLETVASALSQLVQSLTGHDLAGVLTEHQQNAHRPQFEPDFATGTLQTR